MTLRRRLHSVPAVSVLLLALLSMSAGDALAQRRPAAFRDFLLQYKGREVLMMDKTGGVEQFTSGEASKAYTVFLNDVLEDYFVISRQTDNDKRTFAYPMSTIRRIIYLYDGKPYQKIVIEMY